MIGFWGGTMQFPWGQGEQALAEAVAAADHLSKALAQFDAEGGRDGAPSAVLTHATAFAHLS